MLKQRLITAIILLAVFAVTLVIPDPSAFALLTLAFIAVAGWEWSRLNGLAGIKAYLLGGIIAIACTAMWIFNFTLPPVLWLLISIIWLLGAPIILYAGGQKWLQIPQSVRWLLGIFILCMAWLALWSAKLLGNNFLLSALFLVWGADSGAYFFGKAFGKHKLAPKVSPGKSWEGAIGGVITVGLLATAWVLLIDPAASASTGSLSLFSLLLARWSWPGMFIAVLCLVGMSIVGDLTESLMKRSIGMKDSSQILPGHGGVLDRIDALLPVLPLIMALLFWGMR